MNLTKSGWKLLVETEETLTSRRYRCVWSKTDEKVPFDSYDSLWINKSSGKSVMVTLRSVEENCDVLVIYKLTETILEEIG